MDLIPAIDILDGNVVRLLKGDYGAVTRYRGDPVAVASDFLAEGATLVHVVDLDAARGRPRSLAALHALGAAGVPFQAGGGEGALAGRRVETEGLLGRMSPPLHLDFGWWQRRQSVLYP